MLVAYITLHGIVMVAPFWGYLLWRKKNPKFTKAMITEENAKKMFAKYAVQNTEKKGHLISLGVAVIFEIANFSLLYLLGLFN